MNAHITGADGLVGEYLLYRGFTQSFQALENERQRDRTKRFEVTRIVDTIFTNLTSFDIEAFVNLWDFLSKRFFAHLDAEHYRLCDALRSDLLKFYLVHAVRTKSKERILEFFCTYSNELLNETTTINATGNTINATSLGTGSLSSSVHGMSSGNTIQTGTVGLNMRSWYVIPYLEDPEKDPEFAVYFTPRWAELLRITLQNFLSTVLASAPPPKLLLLEKWFRSEAQADLRGALLLYSKKVDSLVERIANYESRMQSMREIIRSLAATLHKNSVFGLSSTPFSSSMNHSTSISGNLSLASGGSRLFEHDDDEVEEKRQRARELGSLIAKTSSEWVRRSNALAALPRDDMLNEILGDEFASLQLLSSNPSAEPSLSQRVGTSLRRELEETETDLLRKLNDWIALLK